MSTTLANAQIELSKQIGDFWNSTTTSGGSSTTLVDTALMAKANDWIEDAPAEMYDRITSGTYIAEERKASSLDNTTGTLTTLAHGGTIATAVTYEIHRLFNASEKRHALISAARHSFPFLYRVVRDDSKTVGNWLRNGDVEIWALTTVPDNWVVSALTCAENTTSPYFSRGLSSVALSGSAGYLYQSNVQVPDLIELAGKSVTFKADVWSDTATDTRLSIYDGTTTTYSDYHAGDSIKANISVSATIADSPSVVRFAIHRGAASAAYADDFRVSGPARDKVYIGDLDLALDRTHRITQSSDSNINNEPWQTLRNYEIGNDGYIYLHEGTSDYRLRIEGMGYLNFLASGVASTDWAATIDIDSPQLDILIAEAVMYLYIQMISPNFTSGERDKFAQMLQYWEKELEVRKGKYGMKPPPTLADWGQ